MSTASVNLTGIWHGIYNYPYEAPPNEFTAQLIDIEGTLSGETDESGTMPGENDNRFPALIEGVRNGFVVRFRKYYDDLRMAADVVHYKGRVEADGSEIAGRWDIPGNWSGTFIMVRPPSTAAEVEKSVSEPVL